jgi:hypothetical protein
MISTYGQLATKIYGDTVSYRINFVWQCTMIIRKLQDQDAMP